MFQAHPVLQPREKVLGFSMGFPARLSPPGCLGKQAQSREASSLHSWYPGPQPYNSLAQGLGAAPTSSAVPGQGSFSRAEKGSAPRSFSPSTSKALARARRCHSYSDSCRLFIHSFISYGQTAQTSPKKNSTPGHQPKPWVSRFAAVGAERHFVQSYTS